MTIEKDGFGCPEFPQKTPLTSDTHGMSLRDYFAAKAPDYTEQWFNNYVGNHGFRNFAKTRAAWNYEYADAMLEARKK